MDVKATGSQEGAVNHSTTKRDVELAREPPQEIEIDSDSNPELSFEDEPDPDSDWEISLSASPRR